MITPDEEQRLHHRVGQSFDRCLLDPRPWLLPLQSSVGTQAADSQQSTGNESTKGHGVTISTTRTWFYAAQRKSQRAESKNDSSNFKGAIGRKAAIQIDSN
jgi:hypothetical protein